MISYDVIGDYMSDLDDVRKRIEKRKRPLNDHNFKKLYNGMVRLMVMMIVVLGSLIVLKNPELEQKIFNQKYLQQLITFVSQSVLDFLPEDVKVSQELQYTLIKDDYYKGTGNQVLAMNNGKVIDVKKQQVTILDENGTEITFSKLKDIQVKKFQKIKQGDTIALYQQKFKMIFEYLPRAYDNGPNDPVAREKMGNAATMAGMAFANAFLGICHSMAHKLGAFHHIPHGIANALMLEEIMRFNASEVPTKMGTFSQYDHPHTLARYAEVADYLGFGGKTDEEKLENLIKGINELKEKIGIKKTIKDYGVDEKVFLDTLDEMVEQAFDDQCTGANPRYPLMKEIKEMYLRAYYGK